MEPVRVKRIKKALRVVASVLTGIVIVGAWLLGSFYPEVAAKALIVVSVILGIAFLAQLTYAVMKILDGGDG